MVVKVEFIRKTSFIFSISGKNCAELSGPGVVVQDLRENQFHMLPLFHRSSHNFNHNYEKLTVKI